LNAAIERFPVNAQEPPDAFDPPGDFYAALSKAQSDFEPIRREKTVVVRTKEGPSYTFAYAPLEAILRATMPALNKHGFALVQRVETDYLVTTLYHKLGQLSGSMKIIVDRGGPQAYGSALMYARRYGVTLLLGICADDDDDGNAAEGNEVTTSTEIGHPSHVLSPAKRELYLPRCAKALDDDNGALFKTLVSELNEGERHGLWSFFSSKQKAKAREIMQKAD
jgi:hypothetical protein